MWEMKSEQKQMQYSTGQRSTVSVDFIENEDGVRLVLRGFDGRIEQGMEAFEYVEGSVSPELLATRFDQTTLQLQDHYTAWLGIALQVASLRAAPDSLTIERARHIARNVKGALLAWRPPGKLSEILGVTSLVGRRAADQRLWLRCRPCGEQRARRPCFSGRGWQVCQRGGDGGVRVSVELLAPCP